MNSFTELANGWNVNAAIKTAASFGGAFHAKTSFPFWSKSKQRNIPSSPPDTRCFPHGSMSNFVFALDRTFGLWMFVNIDSFTFARKSQHKIEFDFRALENNALPSALNFNLVTPPPIFPVFSFLWGFVIDNTQQSLPLNPSRKSYTQILFPFSYEPAANMFPSLFSINPLYSFPVAKQLVSFDCVSNPTTWHSWPGLLVSQTHTPFSSRLPPNTFPPLPVNAQDIEGTSSSFLFLIEYEHFSLDDDESILTPSSSSSDEGETLNNFTPESFAAHSVNSVSRTFPCAAGYQHAS